MTPGCRASLQQPIHQLIGCLIQNSQGLIHKHSTHHSLITNTPGTNRDEILKDSRHLFATSAANVLNLLYLSHVDKYKRKPHRQQKCIYLLLQPVYLMYAALCGVMLLLSVA